MKKIRKNISFVYIQDSIISLEKMMNSTDSQIYYTVTEYERYHLNSIYEWSNILSAHKPISNTEIEMIIFKFRSKLLEMFLNFNDSFFNDELDFDLMYKRKEIDKVVSQTINTGIYISGNSTANINESQIIGGDSNIMNISPQDKRKLENIITQIENICQNLGQEKDEIADEIAIIKNELNSSKQQPKIIKSALIAIKGIAIGVGVNQITPLANQGIEYIKQIFG